MAIFASFLPLLLFWVVDSFFRCVYSCCYCRRRRVRLCSAFCFCIVFSRTVFSIIFLALLAFFCPFSSVLFVFQLSLVAAVASLLAGLFCFDHHHHLTLSLLRDHWQKKTVFLLVSKAN